MSVYDSVNRVLSRLQIISVSEDGKKSHGAFNEAEQYSDFMVMLAHASLEGLWLSSAFSAQLTNFNFFLYKKFNASSEGDQVDISAIKEIAENNYQEIARMKDDLRDQMLSDLIKLHDVSNFLKSKQ
jgi:hypothetical protein